MRAATEAQRLIVEARRLAVEMDVQFRQDDRKTWKNKATAMWTAGLSIVSRSKRDTIAPHPSMAVTALQTAGSMAQRSRNATPNGWRC
ncbi:hypothetical protein [Burkholderia sp. LMG 32019]|uniref:hypothetical protein n=1 Tax=Burkholderia sp. LMG 32019 TaxID=3158173 RepID=UPI003C2C2D3A